MLSSDEMSHQDPDAIALQHKQQVKKAPVPLSTEPCLIFRVEASSDAERR